MYPFRTMQQQQHRPSISMAPAPAPRPATAAKPAGDENTLDVTLESFFAPTHATGDAGLLTDVRAPAPEEQQEEFGGVVHRVAAVGRLASPHFDVPDFRHVPGLGKRAIVVSVGELARRGLVVGFGPGTCYVTDACTGDIVGEGRMRGGRYYLDYLKVPPSK